MGSVEDAGVLSSDFIQEMVKQMRALDTYGALDGKSAEEVLDPLVLTPQRRKEIPIVGEPDEKTMARVRAFFSAIASLIEKECGLMAVPFISVTHEGFGRALITVGKLVVMEKVLRDLHRFGFPSLSKMKDEADKLLSVATTLIGEHPKVAGL